jgi:flagellar biosynthesis protein FliQ
MSSVGASEMVLRAIREGLILAILVSAPALLASIVVGLVVGALQSATQIQDPGLSFVPKLIVVVCVAIALGPLLGAQVVHFAQSLLLAIPLIR